jgi:hypothetical protein
MNTDKTSMSRNYKGVVRIDNKSFLALLLLDGVVVGAGLYYSAAWYWWAIPCLLISLASIAVLWWPVVEPTNGVVRERALLFGKKLLAERVTPLSEFIHVFYMHADNGEGDTKFRIGLRHKTGRTVWVEGCWNSQRAVEETAWEISCNTGIQLKDQAN